MGIFGKKRSLGGTPISEQSDREIRRRVNEELKFGDSISKARYCVEAEKRGIAWRQTDRMAEKKKK